MLSLKKRPPYEGEPYGFVRGGTLLRGRSLRLVAASAILLTGVVLPQPPGSGPDNLLAPPTASAAAPLSPDTIRVALFIDTPKYSNPATAVTLSAPGGLAIRLPSAPEWTLHQVPSGAAVRVSPDGYYAQLPETADAAAARVQAKQWAAAGLPVGIVQRTKRSAAVYRAYVGPYPTREAAAAAAGGKAGAAITGPLRLAAGNFADEAQARAQAEVIAQAGLDADVAYLTAAGWTVLVGEAADAAGLQAVKTQAAAALPGVALNTLLPSQSYTLKRSELAVDGEGKVRTALLYSDGLSLLASPVSPDEGVTVAERFGRAYRGTVEASKVGGKLAVINVLPFESYLYSVLGSELSAAWPAEALKAQAVAARTFALKQGAKYGVADISDTTVDQAYRGKEAEFPGALTAVKATAGEVLMYNNALIDPLYSSNAGGVAADSTEGWGNAVPYLKSATSPDEGAQAGKKPWYRIVLPNGVIGYMHSDYARDTGEKNGAGLPVYESTQSDVSVRPSPYVDNAANAALFKVGLKDRFVVIGQTTESNAFAWLRGPYDAAKFKDKLGAPAGIQRLEVTKRGPSGRATEVAVNGQPIKAPYPDSLRGLLGGLPSTRFEIEETGRYTIQGAGQTVRTQTPGAQPVYVAGGQPETKASAGSQLFVLSGSGEVRIATASPQFVFKGTGNGHGLGMSQWGAKAYAEQGYDYKKILDAYYKGASIVKTDVSS